MGQCHVSDSLVVEESEDCQGGVYTVAALHPDQGANLALGVGLQDPCEFNMSVFNSIFCEYRSSWKDSVNLGEKFHQMGSPLQSFTWSLTNCL